MPAYSAVWMVVVAVVLAGGLLAMMVATRRPEEGYGSRLREIFTSTRGERVPGESSGSVVSELREAAAAESGGIEDLFANADYADAYVTVPERYEERFDERMTALAGRQRALRERLRPSEDVSAQAGPVEVANRIDAA